jgi:hypothetical protein
VIGHVKIDHRMDRNYLKGREGDRANAILVAAGYNFRLLIRWLPELFVCLVPGTHLQLSPTGDRLKITANRVLHGRLTRLIHERADF